MPIKNRNTEYPEADFTDTVTLAAKPGRKKTLQARDRIETVSGKFSISSGGLGGFREEGEQVLTPQPQVLTPDT